MLEAIQEEEELAREERFEKRRVLPRSVLRQPLSVLERHVPICVETAATITAAARLMMDNRVGCLLVTEAERLVGIFTERDVLLKVVPDCDAARTLVSRFMTEAPETLAESATLAEALAKMSRGGFRHLPVVDTMGRPVSVVSVKDIVDLLVESFPTEVLTVPPRPGLDIPRQREGA
ncbi:MAG: CBS domain-containing protein [Candidatus Binatia bacterium]